MRFGNRILKLSGVSLSDSPSPPPCPSSDRSGRESPGSAAGPELPVRFSQCSIASNRDSHDPWSGRSDDSGGSFNGGALGDAAAYTTLTTPTFRQRADKDRSFTASAPPGLRPPSKRQTPGGDDGAEKGIDWAKLSKIESRPAHWLAASSHTCRPYPMPIPSSSCGAKGCPRPPALHSPRGAAVVTVRRHVSSSQFVDAQARVVCGLRVCTVDEAPGVCKALPSTRTHPKYVPCVRAFSQRLRLRLAATLARQRGRQRTNCERARPWPQHLL